MNCRNETIFFVSSAFDLIDIYNDNPNSRFVGRKNAIALTYPYFLGISKDGMLGLYKEVERKYSKDYILAYKRNKQIDEQSQYIGRLLSAYISKIESV